MTKASIAETISVNPPELKPTHIIGIGASAGGLSALEQFFDNMPTDTGMAFVVIQHLSPDFKSLMDDLLSRHTTMPIHRVTSGIELQPNSIYLIPPKTHMTVKEEKLYLTEKTLSPHIELPIDIFFNSLADDAGERAVGVVLSGTGSDGSRGIVSINKNGGLVVVQSPESAQFDGMPRSAIATGVCDFILGPDRIPRILVEYAISPLAVRTRMHHELEVFEDEGEYAGIFALLRRAYNLDFSKYKGSTVGRRIRRRMEFRQIPEVSDYAAIVSGDQDELELLYKDLLIGVTEFFRDKQAFEFLEQEVIPRLFANLNKEEDLRVWSAACATGEEAYSIAILLAERAKEIDFNGKITVFATDVHKTSLDFASQGLYNRARLTNVSPDRMDKYFKKEGGDLFRVTSELRKLVVFAPHNLLNDPPFTRLDLVCCRNLLIYFQTEVQERVISLFHFALKIDGILFLGSSEGLGPFVGEFEVIANQHKMFRKIRDLKLALNLDANRMERREPHIPTAVLQQGSSRVVTIDRQVLADYDTLLRRHMPPGVLINENRQIVHYFGNVAEYLKMPEGRAENNILVLSEDNLHVALSTSFQRADTTRQLVVTRNVRIRRGDGEFLIDLNVSPLPDEKSHTTHYHVYFERVRQTEHPQLPEQTENTDVTRFDIDNHFRQHVADLEMELQSTRESLQTTVEELQTSNEELQATNEELLASNEELQSTNEELHSVNEELYSVNSEFERKNVELKQLNNDHENLLASTDIGTVFLDRQLRIRKYNSAIACFFKLMPQDIGRPIDHIAYHLSQQEEMLADIHRVLSTGEPVEQEEQTRDKTWLLKRIMPFRTETGQVEGVVITFTDITTVKAAELKVLRLNEELEHRVEERTCELKNEIQVRLLAEESLKKQEAFIRSTVDGLSVNICVIDADERIVITNRAWDEFAANNNAAEGTFGEGASYLDACTPLSEGDRADMEEFKNGIRAVLSGDVPEFVKEYPCHSPNEQRWFVCRANAFTVSGANYAVISHENITDRKTIEIERMRNQERLESLIKVSQHPSQNSQELLELALDESIALTRSKFGYIYNYNEETCEFVLNTWSRDVMDDCSIVDPQTCYGLDKTGIWSEVVRQRAAIMLNNFQAHHPLMKEYPEGHAVLHRLLSIPVFDNDRIVAVVAVANKESDYVQTDILQLTLLMDSVWRIIAQSRIEEEKLAIELQFQQAQKLESLGVLAGGIAHDFNNILAIIIGNCNLVKMEYATAEIHVPVIEKAAERAAELCRQMLAYAGKASISLHNVNVTDLVEETVKMLKSAISHKVVITTSFAADIPTIKIDKSQLRQVVMNLIINASESIGDVSGVIHVKLAESEIISGQTNRDHLGVDIKPGWYVCLEVSDTGCGMDNDTKLRVFEPFFTTKFTGRGLGMSAVLGIVTSHKGALQLISQPGQGTTFKIYLPIQEGESGNIIASEKGVPLPWQGSGTILLVEDETQVLMIAKSMIKALGFAVIDAANGREAIDLYQKHCENITMVITDLGMPVMDGYTLFRELKNINPDLPIIIATGFGEIDVTSRINRNEMSGLITKPFNFDQLRSVLKNALDKMSGDAFQ